MSPRDAAGLLARARYLRDGASMRRRTAARLTAEASRELEQAECLKLDAAEAARGESR